MAWDEPTSASQAGAMRWVLERRLGLDLTPVRGRALASGDLSDFDVLLLTDGEGWSRVLGESGAQNLKRFVERGGVLGCALDAWMLVPGWERRVTLPHEVGVSLEHVADHIDHICQIAGNARHVGIGSDLDGCFGTEQTPMDLDTIADLQKLTGILAARGYSADDIEGICWRNFVGLLRRAWK